jgi:hypothetical protein
MADNRFSIERALELMHVKGFTQAGLAELGYNDERVKSWRYTTRRPKSSDAFKIAAWLEVPPQYFHNLAPELEGLPAWKVAARCSLDVFLKGELGVAGDVRAIFEHYAEFPGAPRRAQSWKELYENSFVPAARFGQQRWKEARKMGKSSAKPAGS